MRDNHSIADDLKLFLVLNAALFDTSVAVWRNKSLYMVARPATVIPQLFADTTINGWLGPNAGVGPEEASRWVPYQPPEMNSPPFAEYPSGHSSFSQVGAEILTWWTGSEAFAADVASPRDDDGDFRADRVGEITIPAGSSDVELDVPGAPIVLRWPTFQTAADEAGLSRINGGIHYPESHLRGQELARSVAKTTEQNFASFKS